MVQMNPLEHVEDALDVDVDHVVDVIQVVLKSVLHAESQAGVVHENVDILEFARYGVKELVDRVAAGDIEWVDESAMMRGWMI